MISMFIFAAMCVLDTIVLGGNFTIVSINLLVDVDIEVGSNAVFASSSSKTPFPIKSKVRLSSIMRIPDILI